MKIKKHDFGVESSKLHKSQKINEIVCILDGSGSMEYMKNSTIEGFNSFINEQKRINSDNKTLLTLVIFHDSGLDTVYNRVDIREVSMLKNYDYECYGGTPLLDSIGKVINNTQTTMSEDINSVLCLIMTDGEENTSRNYTKESIKTLVEAKKKSNWSFMFIGANMSDFSEASAMGFSGSTVSMKYSDKGFRSAWSSINDCATYFNTTGNLTRSSINSVVSNYSTDLSTDEVK